MKTPIDMKPPKEDRTLRPDFDYTCECGYYICDTCGYVCCPMELQADEAGYDICQNCERGDMVSSKSNL